MATEALAPIEELEVRLDFELEDEHMTKMAQSALHDASVLVQEYGVATWTADTAPPIAVMLTLKAAARFMNNPTSMVTARAADETNMWAEGNANGVYLLEDEKALLREHKKVDRGFQSVPTYAYQSKPAPRRRGHYIPVDSYGNGTAKAFPDYRPGDVYDPYYPGEMR